MNRHQHPTNNDVLGAPPGVPLAECNALPITRIRYSDGSESLASYWKPSDEELARLNRGLTVRLIIMGRTHAPLHIGVDGDGLL